MEEQEKARAAGRNRGGGRGGTSFYLIYIHVLMVKVGEVDKQVVGVVRSLLFRT